MENSTSDGSNHKCIWCSHTFSNKQCLDNHYKKAKYCIAKRVTSEDNSEMKICGLEPIENDDKKSSPVKKTGLEFNYQIIESIKIGSRADDAETERIQFFDDQVETINKLSLELSTEKSRIQFFEARLIELDNKIKRNKLSLQEKDEKIQCLMLEISHEKGKNIANDRMSTSYKSRPKTVIVEGDSPSVESIKIAHQALDIGNIQIFSKEYTVLYVEKYYNLDVLCEERLLKFIVLALTFENSYGLSQTPNVICGGSQKNNFYVLKKKTPTKWEKDDDLEFLDIIFDEMITKTFEIEENTNKNGTSYEKHLLQQAKAIIFGIKCGGNYRSKLRTRMATLLRSKLNVFEKESITF